MEIDSTVSQQHEDFTGLELRERLVHKAWKARQGAFDELTRLFRLADGPKDNIFRDYQDEIRKAPLEPNAVVLEPALTCLGAFIDGAPIVDVKRMKNGLIGPVLEKGLSSARAGVRAKALDIVQGLIEVFDGIDPLFTEILQTFDSTKQPKVQAAILNVLKESVLAFGLDVMGGLKATGLIKMTVQGFASADKLVRQEAQGVVLAMYRGLAASPASISVIMSLIQPSVKPIQAKELQEALVASVNQPIQITRLTRSAKQKQGMTQQTGQGLMQIQEAPQIIQLQPAVQQQQDPFDLLEPVHVLDKLPENFEEQVTSSAWKERKDALDALLQVLKGAPRIAPGYYGGLVDQLCKRIADTNIQVVISAAQCLETLIKGLRTAFNPHRQNTLTALLERTKERKQTVLDALRAALSALPVNGWSQADLAETLGPFLGHKNPQVKAETLAWLGPKLGSILHAALPTLKRDAKAMLDSCLLPTLDDGSPDVRDSAALACAYLNIALGDKLSALLMEGIDKLKIQRINDHVNKLKSSSTQNQPKSQATKNLATAIVFQPPSIPMQSAQIMVQQTTPAAILWTTQPRSMLDPKEFIERIIGETLAKSLSDTVWKIRLESMDKLIEQHLQSLRQTPDFDPELLVSFLGSSPGWRDSNLQVIAKIVSCLHLVAKQMPFGRHAIALSVSGLADRIAEPKLKQPCADLFTLFAKQDSGNHVGLIVFNLIEVAKLQKSPKILADLLSHTRSTIADFENQSPLLPLVELLDWCKGCFNNSNGTVRTAAASLLALLKRVSPNETNATIDALISAHQVLVSQEFSNLSPPISAEAARSMSSTAVSVHMSDGSVGGEQPSVMAATRTPILQIPLHPRTDITALITPAILTQLADSNWKVRKEALDRVTAIIDSANRCVRLSSGELYAELKERLADSNKCIVLQALSICATLAEATKGDPHLASTNTVSYIRSTLSAIMECLGDAKVQVRQEALRCLEQCLQIVPMASYFVPALGLLQSQCSPLLKKELIGWLACKLPLYKTYQLDDVLGQLVPALVVSLQDRSGDVRKAANQQLMPVLNELCGVEAIRRRLQQGQVQHPGTPTKGLVTSPPQQSFDVNLITSWSTESKASRSLFISSMKRESLREAMQGIMNEDLVGQLFASDFKSQCIAMQVLVQGLQEQRISSEAFLGNFDLLLRYLGICFAEPSSTPVVLMAALELLEHIFALADNQAYRMSETEALALLPHLIVRVGEETSAKQRPRLSSLFRTLCRIYPASKLAGHLLDQLKAKSSNARCFCLEEFGNLVNRCGLPVLTQPSKQIPMIGALIADRDSHVRSTALGVLTQVCSLMLKFIGASTSLTTMTMACGSVQDFAAKYLNGLNPKELDMFEERMKRSNSNNQGVALESTYMEVEEEEKEDTKMQINLVMDKDDVIEEVPTQKIPSVQTTPKRFTLTLGNSMEVDQEVTQGESENPFTEPARDNTPSFPLTKSTSFSTNSDDPIDMMIEQIGTAPDMLCIQAIQKLDWSRAIHKLDTLTQALTVRLRECFGNKQAMELCARDGQVRVQKARLVRLLIDALLQLSEGGPGTSLISSVSVDCLEQLVKETLGAMISECLTQQSGLLAFASPEDLDTLQRHINLLLVRFLENMHLGKCFEALISLLGKVFLVPPPAADHDRLAEMVLKCLWKVTKQIPDHLDRNDLNTSARVVWATHRFFATISPIEWKSRAAKKMPYDDLPLRTVKTILHELFQYQGKSLLNHMFGSLPADSFALSYLQSMAKDKERLENTEVLTRAQDMTQTSTSSSQLTPDQLDERLQSMCTQICSKPNTNAALMELWRFRKEHAYAEEHIVRFIASLGDFFQKYINRQLARVEAEMQTANMLREAQEQEVPTAEAFKARLYAMRRQMFGGSGEENNTAHRFHSSEENLDTFVAGNNSPIANRIANSPVRTVSGSPNAHFASSIIGLKERLARLRKD